MNHLILLFCSLPAGVPGAGVAVPEPAGVPARGDVALHGPAEGGDRQQGPGLRHLEGGARQNVPVSNMRQNLL